MARTTNNAVSERSAALLASSLVWDNHACMPVDEPDNCRRLLHQLQRHRDAGTDVVSLNVSYDVFDWSHGFKIIAAMRQWLQQHADDYLLVDSVADIDTARQSGRLGVFFDLEGAVAVDDAPELVEVWYRLGVRWMLIAYNHNNRVGGGCQDEDGGLTDFGRRVIDEMERVGMQLCLTHTGYRTAREAIEYSNNPVIFSHSNPRSRKDHPRNVPDDLLLAVAASGGVVCLNGIGLFMADNDFSSPAYADMVEATADLIGRDKVGIGFDYVYDQDELVRYLKDNPKLFPPELGYSSSIGMVAPEQIPEITESLLARNWSDDEVRGVLGENLLNLARRVWK